MAPRIKPKVSTTDNRKKYDQVIANIQKIRASYVKVGFPMNDPKTSSAHHESEAGQESAGGSITHSFSGKQITNSISAVGAHSLWSPEISLKATVLEIAVYHEFGAPKANLPERSFMRTSHDLNVKKYEKMQIELFKKLTDGTITLDQALDIAGLMIQTDIKKFLTDGKVVPPSKRAIKEGGKTLVDTAQMLNSITYKKFKGGVSKKNAGIFGNNPARSKKINLKGFNK